MAETIDLILTHVDDAKDRLLEQYKGKPLIEGVICALGQQFQDLEDVLFSLIDGRKLANAIGTQLDLIGTIVGLPRATGLSDDRYRILLTVKIGQNTSQGEPENLISTYGLLTGASSIYYQNLLQASVLVATNINIDPNNDPDDVAFLYDNLESVVAGGVRIDYLVCFSPDSDAFAFAGDNVNSPGLGFGNTLDPNVGGKLAKIHKRIVPFAFAGPSIGRRGFGSIRDPLVGGTLVTT